MSEYEERVQLAIDHLFTPRVKPESVTIQDGDEFSIILYGKPYLVTVSIKSGAIHLNSLDGTIAILVPSE